MTLYTAVRHHRVHLRGHSGPARVEHGFNGRLAASITRRIGSMWTVYICTAVTAAWMLAGSKPFLGFDP